MYLEKKLIELELCLFRKEFTNIDELKKLKEEEPIKEIRDELMIFYELIKDHMSATPVEKERTSKRLNEFFEKHLKL